MASKKKHAIQFIHLKHDYPTDGSGLLIEQLRHAGVVSVMADTDTHWVLRIRAPHGVVDSAWAEMEVERMHSFGINAVVVVEV